MDLRGRGHRPKGLPDEGDRVLGQLWGRLIAHPQDDEGYDRLALDRVGLADDCRLSDLGVSDES